MCSLLASGCCGLKTRGGLSDLLSLCWRPRLPAALLIPAAWAAPRAAERFARSGIELVLNSRVKAVQDGYVTVVDKEGNVSAVGPRI